MKEQICPRAPPVRMKKSKCKWQKSNYCKNRITVLIRPFILHFEFLKINNLNKTKQLFNRAKKAARIL